MRVDSTIVVKTVWTVIGLTLLDSSSHLKQDITTVCNTFVPFGSIFAFKLFVIREIQSLWLAERFYL